MGDCVLFVWRFCAAMARMQNRVTPLSRLQAQLGHAAGQNRI